MKRYLALLFKVTIVRKSYFIGIASLLVIAQPDEIYHRQAGGVGFATILDCNVSNDYY